MVLVQDGPGRIWGVGCLLCHPEIVTAEWSFDISDGSTDCTLFDIDYNSSVIAGLYADLGPDEMAPQRAIVWAAEKMKPFVSDQEH